MLAILLAFALLLLRVYVKPIELKDQTLNFAGHPISFSKATLGFNNGLSLEIEKGNVLLKDDEFSFENANVTFSSRNLVWGNFYPKSINISKFYTDDIEVIGEEVFYGGMAFPLVAKTEIKMPDVVSAILSYEEDYPELSALKTVHIGHVKIGMKDVLRRKKWLLEMPKMSFKRSFLSGEKLEVLANLKDVSKVDNVKEFPIELSVKHPRNSDVIHTEFSTKNFDASKLNAYIGQSNPVQGVFETLKVSSKLKKGNVLESLDVSFNMGESSIAVPAAYEFPFYFNKLSANISVVDNLNKVVIHKLEMEDKYNWPASITGEIRHLSDPEEPFVAVHLTTTEDTKIGRMNAYLPDKSIPGVVGWIRNHIKASTVKNLKLSYVGYPLQIPKCKDAGCGFDGSFDFENMTINFIERLEDATNVNGTFTMKNGRIDILSKGVLNQQSFENAHVSIYNMLSENPLPTTLDVKGTVKGDLPNFMGHIEGIVKGSKPWLLDLTGTQESDLFLSLPLKDGSFESITMRTKTKANNVKSYQYTKGKELNVPGAHVLVDKNPQNKSFTLNVSGDGFIDEIPAKFVWQENLNKVFDETKITVNADLPIERYAQNVKDWGLSVTEKFPVEVVLTDVTKDEPKFTVNANLAGVDVGIPLLNWHKPKDESLNIIAQASVNNLGEYNVSKLNFTGQDVDIEGRIENAQSALPVVDFYKFNVGKSNAKLAFQNNHINIVGDVLDLSSLNLKDTSSQEESVGDTKLSVSVKQLLLKDGVFENVDFEMGRQNGALKDLLFSSNMGEDNNTNVTLKRELEDLVLNATSSNAGYALATLGLFDNFSNGRLKIKGRLKDGGIGELHTSIKDVNLLKAPVLFKLFSVLSIEDIISFEAGVGFDSIQLPLAINENEYIFSALTMKGPSVNLRAKGKLTKEGELDIKGQLIPISRLNKLVSKIPLVGKIITGSQDGLLVADFTAKGDVKNPEISSNPFSFITPGILKDVWGIVVGEGYDPTKPTSLTNQKR